MLPLDSVHVWLPGASGPTGRVDADTRRVLERLQQRHRRRQRRVLTDRARRRRLAKAEGREVLTPTQRGTKAVTARWAKYYATTRAKTCPTAPTSDGHGGTPSIAGDLLQALGADSGSLGNRALSRQAAARGGNATEDAGCGIGAEARLELTPSRDASDSGGSAAYRVA